MKLLVVLGCLVAVALCDQPSRPFLRSLPALRHEELHDEAGQYAFRYISADRTLRYERGYLKKASNGRTILVVEGEYQYLDEAGKLFSKKYKADEFGFHIDSSYSPTNLEEAEAAAQAPLSLPAYSASES